MNEGQGPGMTGRIDLHVGFAFAWADVLLETGLDLNVRRAEGAVASLLGCAGGALVGRRLPDLIAPADRPALDGLAVLAPGTRLTLERVRLAGDDGAAGATVALSVLCLEAPADVLCVALRVLPSAAPAAT